MKFNEEKLQRLNAEVQRGYANLRALGQSAVEIGQEIFRTQQQIAADPVQLARHKHARVPIGFRGKLELSEQEILRLDALEQRLEKLKQKKARIAALYESADQTQTAKARILENAMRFLRERNIEVDLAVDGGIFGGPTAGPISGTVQFLDFPNRGA